MDSRSKRDGRFIEKLGTYDPNTNPASITLSVENSVKWLENGAQPTDTARSILSRKGVLLKKHLNGGVLKGALTQEQAEVKFQAWVDEKELKSSNKKDELLKARDKEREDRIAKEKEKAEEQKAKRNAAPQEETAESQEPNSEQDSQNSQETSEDSKEEENKEG
ncbi:30S ribosomal protein S16 [Ichthyobacterium seriolicida]|uniref:30S ribosomal protein S16 n=2 Tax=Ichthyobacterium seriolicida TaxID=242600 RepID=A0A1J1DYB4_9FLAO|nr:30S ribosomal protein S16 [Ichthyobacterium seriolicida]